jgi:uncharacterized protein (TIGR02145 family)
MKNQVKALAICLVLYTATSCDEHPVPPLVLTDNPTEISSYSSVAGGIIIEDGGADITSKGICWNTSTDPTTEDKKIDVPSASLSFSSTIKELTPGTVYFIRAYAGNSAGVSYGQTKSFKTLGEKALSFANNVSALQPTTATLNGIVNPNSLETRVTFEYGKTTSYENSAAALGSPLTGGENKNVSADLTQLTPGTTYHFRVKTENPSGTAFSDDMTFTTPGNIPAAIAIEPYNTDITSSTLNGKVNPNSLETTITFQYGTTIDYGSSANASQNPLSDADNKNVSAQITSLSPGTVYHFRIKAENCLGVAYSEDKVFKTLGQLPSLCAAKVLDISLSTATLSGSVNPQYLATSVILEWGTTTSYGNSSVSININGHEMVPVSADITGLNPGAVYHFRIKASNELGTSFSPDITFSTDMSDIENNKYNTIVIGNQVWMTENLRSTKYNDGSIIPSITDNEVWRSASSAAYSWYNNDPGNKELYGAYYNWYVVDKSMNGNKNVCPSGWHIPIKSEWEVFLNYLSQNGYGFEGNGESIAKSIAATSGWVSTSGESLVGNDQPSNNSSGFNGVPAGTRSYNGSFAVFSYWAGWWSQTNNYSLSYTSWYVVITNVDNKPRTIALNQTYGASIRCMKD